MRLFIALELPSHVRAELVAIQQRLHAADHLVRWVEAANLHLTLQFLGEVSPLHIAALLAALRQLPEPDFELELAELGAFPHLRRAQVIWVGVGGATEALRLLRNAVVEATAPLGFVTEKRGFYPHLTLGRMRSNLHVFRVDALGTLLERADPPAALRWPCTRPRLFESTQTPQGTLYTRLG